MTNVGKIPNLIDPMEKCATCPIRHQAVCSYSSPAELSLLDKAKFYRTYEPGQTIVAEGEPTQALGSLVTGVVALHKSLEDGRRQMVGLMFPSDFIGRPMRTLAPYDAVAVTDVKMCMFHRSQFERIMSDSRALEHRVLEMTLDELDAAREWMVLLGRKTARERLASFLMILADRQANLLKRRPENGMTIPIPLTREAIAEFLGLTIETVSRQFTGLRKDGIVGLPDRRSFVLDDLEELRQMAGDDDDPDEPNSAVI